MFRPSAHWKRRRSDYMDSDQHRPMLHVMCRDGNTHVVKQMIEYAANINTRCDFGYTPLHYAAEYGHLDIAKILLENSADIHLLDGTKSSLTALHKSICFGHKEVASFLIEKGANIDQKDGSGWSPLHLAILYNQGEIAEILIESGADVHQRDGFGYTPLNMAILEDRSDIVEMLLENGADVNAEDENGDTALHFAIEDNIIKMVNLLIKHGANVNVGNDYLQTPLHLSAKMGHKEITQILIHNGANVNAKRVNGLNPLYDALKSKQKCKEQEEVIEMLVSNGTDINHFVNGHTALHYCSFKNYKEYAKILIQFGASLTIKSGRGYTPLECALLSENYDLLKLLTHFNH